ncbi:hypothetical protein PanWU01x14_002480 [Parasponia andersonii]|uniref:Uncharacterized protein n=1 Tax=Parasponia andersonii TaxID=3476 RepID=A0A2P5E595_PARAD|nr:hypothetical protein PanWU01x14_002480 [Parasponia andersonii]
MPRIRSKSSSGTAVNTHSSSQFPILRIEFVVPCTGCAPEFTILILLELFDTLKPNSPTRRCDMKLLVAPVSNIARTVLPFSITVTYMRPLYVFDFPEVMAFNNCNEFTLGDGSSPSEPSKAIRAESFSLRGQCCTRCGPSHRKQPELFLPWDPSGPLALEVSSSSFLLRSFFPSLPLFPFLPSSLPFLFSVLEEDGPNL